MVDGRITEHGTFDEMMRNREDFARTFDEFVTKDQTESKRERVVDVEDIDDENVKKRQAAMRGAQLMQAEERNTGAVNFQVYKQYFQAAGNGVVLIPIMLLTLVLMQICVVLSSYWCVHSRRLVTALR